MSAADAGLDEISILDILDILHRCWLKIVILALITALAGYFYAVYTYVPMYTTTAMMIVNSKSLTILGEELVTTNNPESSKRLVSTYSVIMRSDRLARLVVEDLGVDTHPNMVKASISVAPVSNTEVMSVTVRNTDPVLAADIANSLMKVAPDIIAETVDVGSVKVVDYAQVPQFTEPPKKMHNAAMGGLLGVMLGVGIAFLFQFLDNTVKNDFDIRDRLGVTLLGGVPKMKRYKGKKRKKGKDTPFIICDWVNLAFQEAYKSIRTNLFFSAGIHNAKTIIVTSALGKEGKTTVAINMAMAISQMDKSVLLFNCDLRRPSISRKLWLESYESKGLSAILNGQYDVRDCIMPLPNTGVDLLPSSSEDNPSELLGTEAMGKLLEELKEQYNYIILDTPPAHLVTDASVLSHHADGVVFVIKQGYAAMDLVSTVIEEYSKLDIKVLGCILNCIDYKKSGSYYKKHYYNRYYNDYYSRAAYNEPFSSKFNSLKKSSTFWGEE